MDIKNIKKILTIIGIIILLIGVLSIPAYSQDEVSQEEVEVQPTFWSVLLENVLALTIVIIFLTAIINAFIKQRSRDKCLKDFKDFHITAKMKDGRAVWGKLKLFSNAMELIYNNAYYDDSDGHYEYSYIMTQTDFESNVIALHRYLWDLTPKNKKRRERSIKITYRPSIFRRFGRSMRNMVNTFKDAFNKSLSLFMGQFGGKIAGGKATGELKQVGTSLIGMAGNAYEAILEKYIGRKIISDIKEGDKIKEYEGILKEYTSKYIELLNVRYKFDFEIRENKIPEIEEFSKVKFSRKDKNTLVIENPTPTPLFFHKVLSGDYEKEINKTINQNDVFEINLEEEKKDKTDIRLLFQTERLVDIIAPRTHITVRHSGKEEKLSISEMLGLDDISLSFIKKKEQEKG
jgi:small nuclear ribonucleoprotein (snRNP)-like protein